MQVGTHSAEERRVSPFFLSAPLCSLCSLALDLMSDPWQELEEAIGFRRVWDAIINSRKPIIGASLLFHDLFGFCF